MSYKEIRVIQSNPLLTGQAYMIPDVVYSRQQGTELKMQIIKPWTSEEIKEKSKYPLIVFVQGSAWTYPDVNYQLPQLSSLAREGYVVATLTHRNSLDGHPFPAFLEDVKTGIRFLKKHAKEYNIDSERVGIFGTSSGGNTALLVGLTPEDNRYKTTEYAEYTDAVKVVIDCFGPTDLTYVINNMETLEEMNEGMKNIFRGLRGENTRENIDKLQEINPVNHITKGKSYPPFLILQGDQDTLVDYEQSLLMYHKLSDAGADATLIRVAGAPHEGSFWSNELWSIIKDFLDKNL